ncbi:DUF502 domain-containing protein [Halovenus marina]|uniref:DUF502 domain-containing protein n=1 Tax=Halovenus marina TaxID=3396621 RepID=UPI003F5467ED
MASWKRDFASGLIVLAPLLVTAVVLLWIYGYLVAVPIPVDNGPARVFLTIVIFILLVFSFGYLMRTAVGAILERAIDDVMNSLPGLRIVYNASKMAVETALSGTSDLQAPVRLEVWDGLQMTAFQTGKTTDDGRDVLFLPTSPNITTGFVIEAHPDRYTVIDESVEDSLTRILSAGFGDADDEPLAKMFGEQSIDNIEESGSNSDGETADEPSDSTDESADPAKVNDS